MTSITRQAKVASNATVLGGGAFGTALAQHLASKGTKVNMWVLEDDTRHNINDHRENKTFLPGVKLSDNILATGSVRDSIKNTEIVLLVIPTPFIRKWLQNNHAFLPVGVPLICCSKGIEMKTLDTPYEILMEEMPGKYHKHLGALSGPSFAKEVAAGNPTNVTLAAEEESTAAIAQSILSDKSFRVYTGNDVIGAELCGALKNVIAIAAGATDGFAFGSNGRAALISRGLAEMTRLIVKKGGNASTLMGLAGVGDLVLTCSSTMSRNYTVGYRLAKGETIQQVLSGNKSVAEGINTSASVFKLAEKLDVDMPICREVYKVIHKGKPVVEALATLQARPLRSESETFEFATKKAKL
eukprot:TRINITY_DN8154_c0_g1_i1.p1 TRINITY_DN8154_c0_g1~~TRINITY_DN8154_c0_g1_i1.p1  ORF type:complete len:363 (+),score=81.82 TRINITY_DN8154_c0_g1_i1:23-1090(+)